MIFIYQFCLLLLFLPNILCPGFVPNTLVRVVGGHQAIKNLKVNDLVASFDGLQVVYNQTLHFGYVKRGQGVKIILNSCQITASRNQKFYLPVLDKWVAAQDLTKQDYLLDMYGNHVEILNITYLEKLVDLYDITVAHEHNFFVSEQNILVHNIAFLAAAPAATVIGGKVGAFAMAYGAKIAAACFAGCFIYKTSRDNAKQQLLTQQVKQNQIKQEQLLHAQVNSSSLLSLSTQQNKELIVSQAPSQNLPLVKQEQSQKIEQPEQTIEPLVGPAPAVPIPVVPEKVEIKPAKEIKQPEVNTELGDSTSEVSVPKVLTTEELKAALDKILADAKEGRKTNGKSTQFEKPGGYVEAKEDFDSLHPTDVKDIPDGETGILADGRHVTVRRGSKDGRPTLEIHDKTTKDTIKIRYGNK